MDNKKYWLTYKDLCLGSICKSLLIHYFCGMKKNLTLRAILALVCVVALACSCKKDEPVRQTTVTINKTSLYDELGITDLMKEEAIGKDDMFIVDSLLIYNEEGSLVTLFGENSDNMNPWTLDIPDLPDGRYTFVAWQTANNNLEHSKGPCWTMQDKDLLSKASITTPYAIYNYPFALGYAAAEVAVHDGKIDVELSPRSMGCIIEVWADHFTEESGPAKMILETTYKERCYGIRLDPALGEADRWVYNLEAYGGYGEVKVEKNRAKSFTLMHGEGLSLDFWSSEKDGKNYWYGTLPNRTIRLNGYYIGYVDMDRWWQQPFFGTPEEFAKWKADRDAGILVLDPFVKWGCTMGEIDQYVKTLDRYYEFVEPVLQSNGSWMISYQFDGVMEMQYFFDTEDCQNMFEICCFFWSEDLPVEMIKNTLVHQGYIYKGVIAFPDKEQGDFFLSSDGKTQVGLYPYEDGTWDIIYQPANPDDLQYLIGTKTKSVGKRLQSSNKGALRTRTSRLSSEER